MDTLLKRAVDFHGHLGPFLVLGLRIGLAGLQEMKLKGGERKLRVTVKLPYSIPFSCAIDGLQIATKCTIGNRRLRIINNSGIEAIFELEGEKEVIVAVNSAFFDRLQKKLPSESGPGEKVRELAHFIASTPEVELLTVSKR
jgi:formylmethanofuran dehydrogenase subunit E